MVRDAHYYACLIDSTLRLHHQSRLELVSAQEARTRMQFLSGGVFVLVATAQRGREKSVKGNVPSSLGANRKTLPSAPHLPFSSLNVFIKQLTQLPGMKFCFFLFVFLSLAHNSWAGPPKVSRLRNSAPTQQCTCSHEFCFAL